MLGALLFTMVALLFIALALRTFSESSATLTEVASVAVQNNVEERLAISILYKQVRKLTASEASASVTVQTGSGSVDASLLDALNDGRFASIDSEPVDATGSPVTAAYAVELEVDLAVSGNCTITVAANSTVFIEIYVPAGQAWVLASKYYAKEPYAWFNVAFSGSRALLYAYSTRPFKLMIDYLEVSTFELAPDVTVTVANEGTQLVDLYAVWLNGWRVDARRVLSPGAQLNVTFTGVQYSGLTGFEVRAVTSTRVHTARFYIERAPTLQPVPRFRITSYTSLVSGPAGSQQVFEATVANIGSAAGNATVEVFDHNDNLVGKVNLSLQPEESITVQINITLPSASGTYTWSVSVWNELTARVDDSKTFTVVATTPSPTFQIVSWNQTITGPAGSKQRFVAVIQNTGSGAGTVDVKVLDSAGALVNSTQITVQAGSQATAALTITLPSTMGTYTWSVIAVNNATGSVDDTKSFTVYAMDLYLKVRSTLTFTGFETLPSGWSSIGGSWSIVSGGVEGKALQGIDNDTGPGKASVYYWASSISGYSSLRAIVQVKTPDGVERLGLALLVDASRLYTIDLDFTGKDKAFEIQYYDRNKWQVVANAAYKPALNVWYAIYLEWSWSGSSNVFSAVLYDASGNQLASIPATSYTGPRPAYIGLVTDGKNKVGLFDNFVVATGDPRYVVVSGLQQGWTVELYDASGNLVASAIADSSGTARLFVAARPTVANAKITVKDAQGAVVIERTFSQVVGGDEYTYGP